jgi:hypothetical protein
LCVAAADVAVEMGPRNRRRLTTGGIVGGVVVAVAAAVLLTQSPDNAGVSPGRSGQPSTVAASQPEVVFGMTKQQVQRITGAPTSKEGSCWFFQPKGGMVGPIDLRRTLPGYPQGVLRLCFYGGQLSSADQEVPTSSLPKLPGQPKGPQPPQTSRTGETWMQNPCNGHPCAP